MTCSTCGAAGASVYHQGTEDEIILCPPCLAVNRADWPPVGERVVNESDRGDMLRWLIDNDPNGCYGDTEVREELGSAPMVLTEVWSLYRHMRYGEPMGTEP